MKQPINNGELTWVGIDFDSTICINSGLPDFVPLEVIKGTIEAITEIRKRGFKPIIYTARGWEDHEIIEKWCKKNGIVVDNILCGKPLFRWLIDDRCIGFRGDWKKTLKEVV